MKSRLQNAPGIKMFGVFTILLCLLYALVFAATSYAAYSTGPRQTGEEILEELLLGQNKFIARVASNGYTDKNSFKIAIKKEPGFSAKTPHYRLTINRIEEDEGKAIVDGGILIVFDLEKDLGLRGDFTYSITNRVSASSKIQSSKESLFSIIEKYFTFDFPVPKEVKPEPFTNFVMVHDYFSCLLPADWKPSQDPQGDEEDGIFEIILIAPEKAGPEDDVLNTYPEPLLYAGYYAENNKQNKTYQSYLQEYEDLVQKKAGSDKSHYQKMKSIVFNGKEAAELNYEVYLEIPRGPLATVKY